MQRIFHVTKILYLGFPESVKSLRTPLKTPHGSETKQTRAWRRWSYEYQELHCFIPPIPHNNNHSLVLSDKLLHASSIKSFNLWNYPTKLSLIMKYQQFQALNLLSPEWKTFIHDLPLHHAKWNIPNPTERGSCTLKIGLHSSFHHIHTGKSIILRRRSLEEWTDPSICALLMGWDVSSWEKKSKQKLEHA